MAAHLSSFGIALWMIIVDLLIVLQGRCWAAPAYDPTAYIQCLPDPDALLYEGGIVSNPDFEEGLSGWSALGSCTLKLESSTTTGNKFVVATNRTAGYNGPSQLLPNLTTNVRYSLSAWLRVEGPVGTSMIKATVATESRSGKEYLCAGTVIAKTGCWSFLKGGFSLDHTPIVASRLYFETINFTSGIDIWLDRVSVQPFGSEEWSAHQRDKSESLRRRTVSLRVVDSRTKWRLHDAKVDVARTKLGFPFGSATGANILNDQRYQSWFLERFNTVVFENELKWYSTEQKQGVVNYETSDKMVEWAEANNLTIRGHNIVWDDPKFQQQWVKGLAASSRPGELEKAVMGRVRSVVGRYAGRMRGGWDVSNEQLHFSFYEDALGNSEASTSFFAAAQQLDPQARFFVNDYNVIEECNDVSSTPDVYTRLMQHLQASALLPPSTRLGVGLESHFGGSKPPNLAFMRSALDKLAVLGLPIWLTEIDINLPSIPNRNISQAAIYLDEVLREAISHPAVAGIMLWTGWHSYGCYRMCLTDSNMASLPTGDVVDKLLTELQQVQILDRDDHYRNQDQMILMRDWHSNIRWRGPVGEHTISVRWRHTNFTATVAVVPGKGTQRVVLELPVNGTCSTSSQYYNGNRLFDRPRSGLSRPIFTTLSPICVNDK